MQIGVFAPDDVNHTGEPIALHNSMTDACRRACSREPYNPGQLGIVRTIRNSTTQETDETADSDGVADVDTAVFSGELDEYDIALNADGTTTVAHTGGLATDGTDTLSNIEQLQFSDATVGLIGTSYVRTD